MGGRGLIQLSGHSVMACGLNTIDVTNHFP